MESFYQQNCLHYSIKITKVYFRKQNYNSFPNSMWKKKKKELMDLHKKQKNGKLSSF